MKSKPSINYMELVKDKKDLFEGYRITTLQLKEALAKKSLRDAQSCIAKRRQISKQINRIDTILENKTIEGNKDRDVINANRDNENGGLFKDMEQIINEISTLENDCINLATTERDLLKKELLGYQHGKRGTKGYRSSNAAPAKFIDTMVR